MQKIFKTTIKHQQALYILLICVAIFCQVTNAAKIPLALVITLNVILQYCGFFNVLSIFLLSSRFRTRSMVKFQMVVWLILIFVPTVNCYEQYTKILRKDAGGDVLFNATSIGREEIFSAKWGTLKEDSPEPDSIKIDKRNKTPIINDKDYRNRVDVDYNLTAGRVCIILKNLTINDTNEYILVLHTKSGKRFHHFRLEVSKKERPKITGCESDTTITAVEGERFTFPCSISGSEPLTITWTKGTHVWNTKSLIFDLVNRRSNGTYNLTVSNGERYPKAERKDMKLDVHFKPESTSVTITPNIRVFYNGSLVQINCTSHANPPAVYSLYRNDTLVQSGSSSGYFNVTLNKVGNYRYTCVPSNVAGVGQNKSTEVLVVKDLGNARKELPTWILSVAGVLILILIFGIVFLIHRCCWRGQDRSQSNADITLDIVSRNKNAEPPVSLQSIPQQNGTTASLPIDTGNTSRYQADAHQSDIQLHDAKKTQDSTSNHDPQLPDEEGLYDIVKQNFPSQPPQLDNELGESSTEPIISEYLTESLE